MAGPFNVRLTGYSGIIQVEQVLVKQYNADSVFLLQEPYLWSVVLVVPAGGGAVYSPPQSPDLAKVVRVEIPDGQQVRYEVNPNGPLAVTARVAGNASPRLAGFNQFAWGSGYSMSFTDASFWP